MVMPQVSHLRENWFAAFCQELVSKTNGYISGPNGRGLYCCEDGINPFAEVRAACLGFVTGSANLFGFANSSHGS